MLAGALDSVSMSLEAIIIILFVGCLIGSFEYAGTIPAVVYYGLNIVTELFIIVFSFLNFCIYYNTY